MSLNKFTDTQIGKDIKLQIGCDTLECETLISENQTTNVLFTTTINTDVINISTNDDQQIEFGNYPDQSTAGYVLHTDGVGSTYWAPDIGTAGGIVYSGGTTNIGRHLKSASVDGLSANNSLLLESGTELDVGTLKVINASDPTNPQDLTTLNYTDLTYLDKTDAATQYLDKTTATVQTVNSTTVNFTNTNNSGNNNAVTYQENGINGVLPTFKNNANLSAGSSATFAGVGNCTTYGLNSMGFPATATSAFGSDCLINYKGDRSCGFGWRAMRGTNSTVATTRNSGYGHQALFNISTGTNNVSMGDDSAINLTSGSYNTILGSGAGVSTTTATGTTAIGASANANNNSNSIALGYQASCTAANQMRIANINHIVSTTAADLGTTGEKFKDAYLSGSISSEQQRVKLIKNVLQAVAPSSGVTAIWDSTDFNTGCIVGASYIEIVTTGVYTIGYEISYETNTTGDREAFMTTAQILSPSVRRYGYSSIRACDTSPSHLSSSSILSLTAGTRVYVHLLQSSGVSLNVPFGTAISEQGEFYAYRLC